MAKDKQKAQSYTSENIETLRFPDSIRKSPGMYIGGTDEYARWIVAKELLDNALDEALAGRNNMVWLDVTDGVVTVVDNGHGIPQGIKKYDIVAGDHTVKVKMPTMQAVFGELHTSGKFRDDAYKRSVGTHGVGAKATNATAEFFEVYTCYEDKWYSVKFERGVLKSKVQECKAPKDACGVKLKKGTLVRFKHDAKIFGKGNGFPLKYAQEWGEIMSYLTPGFQVKLGIDGKLKKDFLSKKGPRDYIDAQLTKLKAEAEPKMLEHSDGIADVVVAFSNYGGDAFKGFTNGSYNAEGGKHVDAVTGALYKALLSAGKVKLVKAKKKGERAKAPFAEGDVKEGLVGLINAKLHKPLFNSQDKVKLVDDRMGSEFEESLTKAFTQFFKDNKALCKRLIDRALALNELKTKFTLDKKSATQLNKLRRQGMPAKFAPPGSGVKAEDCELLLVEGDSAGGGIRKARFAYQSLLPLKGKIVNALKDPKRKALQSEEVLHILGAIGYDPNAKDPMAKLRVGKIICVADPDPDGAHINSLLLALFYKYLPDLFERGMIYVAETPEFYALHKGTLITGDSLSEVQGKLKKINAPNVTVSHIKGWGEVDAPLLKLLVLDPETRRLIRIKAIEEADRTDFVRLMNDDVEYRRDMLGIPVSEARKAKETAKKEAKAAIEKARQSSKKAKEPEAKAKKVNKVGKDKPKTKKRKD